MVHDADGPDLKAFKSNEFTRLTAKVSSLNDLGLNFTIWKKYFSKQQKIGELIGGHHDLKLSDTIQIGYVPKGHQLIIKGMMHHVDNGKNTQTFGVRTVSFEMCNALKVS